jgi:phospholipid/cholesterol/gamma-HCH transport system substrate-binding protein
MKPLKERNQTMVGAVTMVLLVLSVIAAMNANDLPLIGGGTTYSAYFAESAGIEPDNEVQIAGVRVGEVQSVELEGKQVLVTFRIDREGESAAAHLGRDSMASIEIKTLLGEKHLALQPAGSGRLDANEPIPLSRTRTPFQIQDAFNDLSTTVSDVDTKQLAKSFDVIAESFAETPEHLTDALHGLSALSKTVAARDHELGELLGNTSKVSKLVSGRNSKLRRVISDGNDLLEELQGRKKAIHALLTGTKAVSEQLSALVKENRGQLRPALTKLDRVTDVLQRNVDNLDRSLELLAPFTRIGANATGNGRWFEGYLCGLFPPTITAAGLHINPQGCELPVSAPEGGN